MKPTKFNKIKLLVLDFDGVFTDNKVIVNEDGKESVVCSREDGLGIALLKKTKIKILIISHETNPVVYYRCSKLGIHFIQCTEDKLKVLKQHLKEEKMKLEEVCYVGNDVNDITCMKAVGIAISVGDAHPDVIAISHYNTQKKGGEGAVRVVCEWLGHSKDKELFAYSKKNKSRCSL